MSALKRPAPGAPGPHPPAPKRGPGNEFDDLIDEVDDMYDDEVPDEYLPEAEGALRAEPDLCEAGRNWLRPPPANLQPARDALGEPCGRQWRRDCAVCTAPAAHVSGRRPSAIQTHAAADTRARWSCMGPQRACMRARLVMPQLDAP